MLATMPQSRRNSKCSRKSFQSASAGHCPLSGNADTALRRADWNRVSTPSTYGDDADRAMKYGTYGPSAWVSHTASSALAQPMWMCWPNTVNCRAR